MYLLIIACRVLSIIHSTVQPGVARIAVAGSDSGRLNTALQRLQLNVQRLCDDVPPRRGLPYVRTGPPKDRASISSVQAEHEKHDNKSEVGLVKRL